MTLRMGRSSLAVYSIIFFQNKTLSMGWNDFFLNVLISFLTIEFTGIECII